MPKLRMREPCWQKMPRGGRRKRKEIDEAVRLLTRAGLASGFILNREESTMNNLKRQAFTGKTLTPATSLSIVPEERYLTWTMYGSPF